MKNKRWLFILLGFLFLINISFLIITRFIQYDQLLIERLVSFIEDNLDAETTIGTMSVSDTQLHLSDIRIIDKKEGYEVKIPHMYLNYNLLKVIFSNIRLFKAVESVSIIEPEILIRFESRDGSTSAGAEKKNLTDITIPDIGDYFQLLNVIDGTFTIEYRDNHIHFRDSYQDFDLEIINNRDTIVNLMMYRDKKHVLTLDQVSLPEQDDPTVVLDLIIDRDEITSLDFLIRDYKPTLLTIHPLEIENFSIELEGSYDDNLFQINGFINDLHTSYEDKIASAKRIEVFSYNDRWFMQSDNLILDGNNAHLDIELRDLLSNPDFNLLLEVMEIPLERYLSFAEGSVDSEIRITGSPLDPEGHLRLSGEMIKFFDEVIDELVVTGDYLDNVLAITLQNALWQNNHIYGDGSFSVHDGLLFNIDLDDLDFVFQDYEVKTDINAEVSWHRGDSSVVSNLKNLSLENESLRLTDIDIALSLHNNEMETQVSGNRFSIDARGDFNDMSYAVLMKLQGLNLNEIIKNKTRALRSYPYLNGDINVDYNNSLLQSSAVLRMYNLQYGELEGNIRSYLTADYLNNSSEFSFTTRNTTYRREPFSIDIKGVGTLDSLYTERFSINEDLFADMNLVISPELRLNLHLKGESLTLNHYLHYFLTPHTARQFDGNIDLDINLSYPEDLIGSISGSNLSYKNLGPYNNDFHISLIDRDTDRESNLFDELFQVNNRLKSISDEPLVIAEGTVRLNPSLDADLYAVLDSLSLKDLLPEIGIEGIVNSEWFLRREDKKTDIGVQLKGFNVSYRDLNSDSIHVDIHQTDEMLFINYIDVTGHDHLSMSVHGNLGYNIINNRIFTAEDQIDFHFQGDLLKTMANNFSFIEEGSSEAEINLFFGIRQDELAVMSGDLVLTRGSMKILNQTERVENITLDFLFEDNRMKVNSFEGRAGEGRLILRNEIKDDDYDFEIGMLKLGHFYAQTAGGTINVHIPKYFPHNSTGNVIVSGRDTAEAEIRGPFDDIKMTADLFLSNASVTYPSETENLFKLINVATERRTYPDRQPLPFELDLKLIASHQVRYVTYPLNLILEPNSYINLLYRDNQWIPNDAFFASESGSLDMFGTTFNLDYADFYITHDLDDYRLRGVFFRYAYDGSLITLDIYNETNGSSSDFLENMNFQLRSDNPEDRTTLHILSKIRYNRSLEEIPRSQQNALLQDEFLQLAGIGLTGAIVDPIISPFINKTRQILRLDFFSIKPSLFENIVRTYGFHESNREPVEEREIIQFSKDILLNNLSITMGKFIARDLYADYEILLQKPVDVVGRRDLLLFQNFTFHYNLPYRMRLAYRFYLKPAGETNAHEVFIRRSFSFW